MSMAIDVVGYQAFAFSKFCDRGRLGGRRIEERVYYC